LYKKKWKKVQEEISLNLRKEYIIFYGMHLHLVIAMDNHGVCQGYPYPYPSKPIPVPKGRGLVGQGKCYAFK